METLVVVTCGAIGLAILWTFFADLMWRKRDLMSWRNLFLLGFLHFVCLSGYYCVTKDVALKLSAVTPRTMLLYAITITLFFVLFMASSRLEMRKGWVARWIPNTNLAHSGPGVLIAIATLLGLGFVMAAIPQANYLGLLAVQFRSGMAATAVGLATYYLLAQRFNPLSWGLFVFALALGVLVSVVGGIGRRDVLGVLIAVPWMWYWAYLRYRGPSAATLRLGAATVAGLMAIVVYSGVRGEGSALERRGADINQRASQLKNLLSNPTVTTDAVQYMLYTDTAGNTMYIFANYPSVHPYTPFHGLWWIITNPIPRNMFPNKPVALGGILRDQMHVDPNLGPGIIGQGWTEGGWFGLVAYAVAFGLLYGAMDRALADRAGNPFFIAVAAAGAGNVLAMPRGDAALFLIQILAAMISSAAVLYGLRLTIGPTVAAFPRLRVKVPGLAPQYEASADDEVPSEASDGAGHFEGAERQIG